MKVCTTCGAEYGDEQSFCPADGTALRSAAGGADLVGSIIADRYRILSKLGEGGMGAVYLAEHVKMGRKCAIKVMARSMAQDADAIARFNREAANAARITHPNVCAIYDFGDTAEGLIYLAMEFIEGEALTDLLQREGPLPPARAAAMLGQAAEALDVAHTMSIVHRDLKPDNIMIATGRDGTDLVKVVDFGIAKAVGGDEEQNVTRTGLVVGTPEYMSPEQLSGDKVDGRSDIYSLGLVFFRMLTGALPFRAETAQEVMIKRLTDDPLRLADEHPAGGFPPGLQPALDRALARMPSARYASAAEFGRDVARAMEGAPAAPARPAVDTEGATQLLDPAAVAAGTEVIPSTQVGGAAPTPDTAVVASSKPNRTKKAPVGMILGVVAALAVTGGGAMVVMQNRGATADPAPPADSSQLAAETVTQITERQPDDADAPTNSNNAGRQPDNRPANAENRNATAIQPPPGPTGPPAWMSLNDDAHIASVYEGLVFEDARPAAARDTGVAYYEERTASVAVRSLGAHVAAEAFAALGDTVSARQWVERALSLNPTSASLKTLQAALTRGGNE